MEALQEASVHPGKPFGKPPHCRDSIPGLARPHPALSAADVSVRTELPPPRSPHSSSSSSAAAAAAARCFDLDFGLGFQGMCGLVFFLYCVGLNLAGCWSNHVHDASR